MDKNERDQFKNFISGESLNNFRRASKIYRESFVAVNKYSRLDEDLIAIDK